MYFSGKLTRTCNNEVEINNRIASCIPTMRSLNRFWTKVKGSIKWKLNVYNAVITSKVIYGLETTELTENLAQRLDAFQQKRIRKILKIPPTFIDRSWTNEKVMRKANSITQKSKDSAENGHILKISQVVESRRLTLLGHILRRA